MVENQLATRITRLEKRERVVHLALASLIILNCVWGAWQWQQHLQNARPGTLKLRRLDIVDRNGISRVILAAPAPPPMLLGKTHKRDADVSGIIIVDGSGTERGGYVTSDGADANALFTLDGRGKQTVLLLAEPTGATMFRVWNGDVGSLTMGVASSNTFFNIKQHGSVVFDMPVRNRQLCDPNPLYR